MSSFYFTPHNDPRGYIFQQVLRWPTQIRGTEVFLIPAHPLLPSPPSRPTFTPITAEARKSPAPCLPSRETPHSPVQSRPGPIDSLTEFERGARFLMEGLAWRGRLTHRRAQAVGLGQKGRAMPEVVLQGKGLRKRQPWSPGVNSRQLAAARRNNWPPEDVQ